MRITEQQKEKLRTLTAEILLTLRAAYLATPGKNVRRHWQILADRTRASAMTTTSPEEWFTSMLRGLQISAVSLDNSACLIELIGYVNEHELRQDWLDLVEREWGVIIAYTRRLAEERKASKEEEKDEDE